MPLSVMGAESFVFELCCGAFYTGVKDGRILRYDPPTGTFIDFTFTSPRRLCIFACMDSIFAPAAMFPISLIIFFLSLPSVLHSFNFVKLPLPLSAIGPESSAFDAAGAGPYTGVADGRVLKYVSPVVGFVDYGVTSPNRSKALCVGDSIPALGPTCGRPLGLGFNNLTGDLYIADAYLGLLVLPKNQKIATQLATSANGVPFRSPDGLDVDPVTGDVQILLAIAKNDSTGRLLKYDIKTKQVTVLLKGLSGPAGTAVSPDGTFVLVTEFIGKRIQKYWLKGPKANTAEVLITFKGRPDNIKRNPGGDFWVAVNQETIIPLVMKPEGTRLDANGTVKESRTDRSPIRNYIVPEVSASFVFYWKVVRVVPRVMKPASFQSHPSPGYHFHRQSVVGAESFSFELRGGTFYTGVKDGGIIRYDPPTTTFTDFAFTSARRTNGRLATSIATSADGEPFRFCNSVDVDQQTGVVFFTNGSTIYDLRNFEAILTGDSTGRLSKYERRLNKVTVLLWNLSGPVGTAVSEDGSYVLVSEYIGNRTIKYWIRGVKADTYQTIGFRERPDNIRRI
ncbi:hypothetical protein Pint_16360 [Pistacia integerrima]|uniref:Uncharacterized protein n=1 Tax=Pistacia integerrima TaxID=434235 RepID=A0ACC0ZCW7_9ROSI|nr:hypothetical protein Pint_16360 [Pistacia integerrima]